MHGQLGWRFSKSTKRSRRPSLFGFPSTCCHRLHHPQSQLPQPYYNITIVTVFMIVKRLYVFLSTCYLPCRTLILASNIHFCFSVIDKSKVENFKHVKNLWFKQIGATLIPGFADLYLPRYVTPSPLGRTPPAPKPCFRNTSSYAHPPKIGLIPPHPDQCHHHYYHHITVWNNPTIIWCFCRTSVG